MSEDLGKMFRGELKAVVGKASKDLLGILFARLRKPSDAILFGADNHGSRFRDQVSDLPIRILCRLRGGGGIYSLSVTKEICPDVAEAHLADILLHFLHGHIGAGDPDELTGGVMDLLGDADHVDV